MFTSLLYQWFVALVVPLICLTILLYALAAYNYGKWQRLGLDYDQPKMPFGSLHQFCMGTRPFGLIVTDIYRRFQGPLVGIYLFFQPALVVRDAELVRRILTTDFASFNDRGMHVSEKDPITETLMTMKFHNWRNLRTKLTPAFSSGQLKGMLGTMDKLAGNLTRHVARQLSDGAAHSVDMRSMTATYGVDIIGSLIFGLNINSFANPSNEFHALGQQVLESKYFVQKLWSVMNFVCPKAITFLSRLGFNDPAVYGMRDIVTRLITFREKSNVVLKDVLQLLIKLRKNDQMSNDNDEGETTKSLPLDKLASNSLLFYVAGSASLTSTTFNLIYEFALNPEICKRAQAEVDNCLQKHGLKPSGPLTYEALEDMQFLDLCIKETLRKYPGLPFLNRECTQDYPVPGTDFTIKKGTAVFLPIFAIQRDPAYYPNPMEFQPERCTADKLANNRVAYMPFGEGPRLCIAKRMGALSVKVAVAKMLANFRIEPLSCRKEMEYKFFMMPDLVPKDGTDVTISKRW